jgi:O-succinylbenzoate synthase
LKLKLKNLPVEEAVKRVKKIQAQGSYEIRLDCNRSWTLNQAMEFTRFFQLDDFAYLEEPIRSFVELKEFSLRTGFPLAADESLPDSPWEQIPTLKAAIVKPTVLGKVPTLPPHIDLVLSGAYESGIGTLHIGALFSKRAAGLDTYRYLEEDLLKNPLRIEEGFLIWDGEFEIDRTKLLRCF